MNSKSFTLVELMVVIGIIVLLTIIILPNYRTGERQLALQRASQKLAQDIRRMAEFSMAAKEFQDQIPLGGYGLHFKVSEKKHYILFADFNGNYQYDASSDGLVEKVKIEKHVQIYQLSASPLEITFTPPDPKVTITPESELAQITLSLETNTDKIKTVKVNKAGLVYVE